MLFGALGMVVVCQSRYVGALCLFTLDLQKRDGGFVF